MKVGRLILMLLFCMKLIDTDANMLPLTLLDR
jgi:hypothetical protein